MRNIVRCSECLRQYDVRDRPVGEKIHCACGDVIVVQQPRGHDAAVVRCSACGGASTDDDRTCGHCGATLTVHERDLHTVCPGCLARISDRAAFCHGCGLRIVAESIDSAPTEWPCPACSRAGAEAGPDGGRRLRSRRFDDEVGGAECVACGGLFIEHKVFAHLESKAQAEPSASAVSTTVPSGFVPPAPSSSTAAKGRPRAARQTGPLYRPCPVCASLMNRQNYGRKSGVVIDTCREHGIWFDDDELERVLTFVRDGGVRRVAALEAEEAREQARRKRLGTGTGGGLSMDSGGSRGLFETFDDGSPRFDVVDAIRWFFRSARGLR